MFATKQTTIVPGIHGEQNSTTINIGTGVNYSVLDLVNLIGGEYIHISPREGEAKETLADISIAKKCLNWAPKINLEDWLKNK